MSDEVERRIIRAQLLYALSQAEEKVAQLDIDAADWHKALREAWLTIDMPASMALNEMNKEVIRLQLKRQKQ
jgi:hypothetical protein